MIATKEDLNILEANYDRKIDKMSNVLLEKLQNLIDKTFGSAEINHRSISDDGNQNKCPHEIGLSNDQVQSVENCFLKNEIHELTTLLNTITQHQHHSQHHSLVNQKPLRWRTHYMKNLTVKKQLKNWVMLIAALII